MSRPDLRIAVTTASFLPLTAFSNGAIDRVCERAKREGLAGVELLVTRAACRGGVARRFPAPLVSVHEVWNPRDTLAQELTRIVFRKPQSRGMIPYPMDAVFFANGDVSEKTGHDLAGAHQCPFVVSNLESPVTGRIFRSKNTALQIHPDLGKDGDWMTLPDLEAVVKERDLRIVFDTYHVRRRVRLHLLNSTEIAPPPALPSEKSIEGIARTWSAFRDRVVLVHFQCATAGEIAQMISHKKWPSLLEPARELVPEWAERGIPVVLEISPPMAAEAIGGQRLLAKGLDANAMWSVILRIRDTIADF